MVNRKTAQSHQLKWTVAAAIVLTCYAGQPAIAGVVTSTTTPFSLAISAEDETFGGESDSAQVELDQVDVAPGDILAATIELTGTLTTSLTANAEERAPDGATSTQGSADFDVFLNSDLDDFTVPLDFSDFFNSAAFCDAGFEAPCSDSENLSTMTLATFVISPDDYDQISGTGTIPIDLSLGASFMAEVFSDLNTGVGSVDISADWVGNLTLDVETRSIAVSAPPAAALFMLAVVALGVRQRRGDKSVR